LPRLMFHFSVALWPNYVLVDGSNPVVSKKELK